jgi:hypothetical protein
MARRTRLNSTLYVHCQSYSFYATTLFNGFPFIRANLVVYWLSEISELKMNSIYTQNCFTERGLLYFLRVKYAQKYVWQHCFQTPELEEETE